MRVIQVGAREEGEHRMSTAGDWCNGNRDGHGVYIYGNGDSYKVWRTPGDLEVKGAAGGISYNCDWSNNIPAILPAKLKGVFECLCWRSRWSWRLLLSTSSAETSERLEFEASRQQKAQGLESSEGQEGQPDGEGSEEKENEADADAQQGPKPLAELLLQDFQAGSEIPRLVIQVCAEDGTPQSGETGTGCPAEREEDGEGEEEPSKCRSLEYAAEAAKEGETEPEAGEEVQADKAKFKRYPSKAYPLQQAAGGGEEKANEGGEEAAAGEQLRSA
eukprot:765494-Hanusia_phi.AAC.8